MLKADLQPGMDYEFRDPKRQRECTVSRRKVPLLLSLGAWVLLHAVSSNAQSSGRTALPLRNGDPALIKILNKLQENEMDYKRRIPNILSQEEVRSEVTGRWLQRTETVSTFRLRRIASSGTEPLLEETRTLRLKDGEPVSGERLAAPAVLEGVFSRGLDPVRTIDRVCFQYSLKRGTTSNAIIRFQLLPANERDADCPDYDGASGQAWIDLESTHITRVEMHIPHHHFENGIVADWKWSATFAPQPLNAQTFWLPALIRSTAKPSDHRNEWRFTARYSDYHLLHVESRILPQ